MNIEPSSFVWKQFKNYLHFYFLLPAIPLSLITAYAHIFIGDAELTEIPEGYVPHNYEYYKVLDWNFYKLIPNIFIIRIR